MKTSIALIGLCKVGFALAKALSNSEHRVLLFDKTYSRAAICAMEFQALYPNCDVEAIECSAEAAWESDIIIIAVPGNEELEVAEHIKELANQKIVASISNHKIGSDEEKSSSAILRKALPNSKLVIIYTALVESKLSEIELSANNRDCQIAGDDETAINTIAEIAISIGLNPVIVGKNKSDKF